MSIHYLLDGYNISHQMPALKLDKLEDQRRNLVRFIEQCSPQGSSKNSVTIVFDGDRDVFGGMKSTAAKIIFSQGESADDKIRAIVARANNTKSIVVVTDDRDIQYAVGAIGAKAIGVAEFLGKGKSAKNNKHMADKKSQRIKKGLSVPEKYISKSDESSITSEMGKIWLKSDGKSGR